VRAEFYVLTRQYKPPVKPHPLRHEHPLRRSRPPSFGLALPLVVFALAAGPVVAPAQPSIPLPIQLAEVDTYLKAQKTATAAELLDEIIRRVEAGEKLPSHLSFERLLLAAATTRFQAQDFGRAVELAEALEKRPAPGAHLLGEARMIRGLSLALQGKYAEAVPVFKAAEDAPAFRDKALLYGAMSAAQAGQTRVAIETYNRLLAGSTRDRDWGEAALSLIDLHLRAGNLDDARRGLALLRGKLDLVDNLAGLNLLSLQLGDAFLKQGDHDGALAAFRTVSAHELLVTEQHRRNAVLERALGRLRGLARPSATEADMIRRLGARLDQAKASLAQVEKIPDFDATLRYRLAVAFQERGGPWEAALLFEDIIARFPESPERENAYLGLVRAYADADRLEKTRDAVERFSRAYHKSKLGPQALYLAAQAAARQNDLEGQLDLLGLAAKRHGARHAYAEPMALMRANALFTLGRHADARDVVLAYVKSFPKGKFVEDARYLAAMADLAEGRATEAEKQIRAYLKTYPKGRFVPDARHRLAAVAYSQQNHKACAELCDKWLADYPATQSQRGEVHALRADALVGLGRVEEAVAAYQRALALPLSDEQLGYVLDELTRHLLALKNNDAAVAMWERFAAEQPEHPYVINAAYWISRIRNREGRSEEAVELVSTIIRRHVIDPDRGDVERLLVELAASLARPPRRQKGEPKPEPVADPVLFERVEQLLLAEGAMDHPTARARVLFTQSEIAALRENTGLRDELLGRIASTCAPDQLPPGILGKVGDTLLALGQPALAKKFYDQIVVAHPKSVFADFGYVGLGEIALREGKGDEALGRFTEAIDRAGARFKHKEATLGRARAQLLLGRPEAARVLLEEVAANRAWRGEATAEALFLLGEIALRRGAPDDLAKAQAHFQRIYLSYKRYPAWVAKAYLRSAKTFDKLGQHQEALTTVNRFFTFRELERFPEWQQALDLKPRLEARVVANPPALAAAPAARQLLSPMRRSPSPPLDLGHWALVISAAVALASPADAQRYILKDGTVLQATEVTLGPGGLAQQVKLSAGGSFERRYPVSDLARIDFPEPETLDEAEKLVAAGKGAEALLLLDPVHRQFAPFAKIPGSHWPRAARLRLQALLQGEDASAIASAARELLQSGLGPELTGLAKLALARLDVRAGNEALARAMLDEIAREAPPEIQARAWLLRGDLALARSAHAEALECYLRIPAFFGALDELMPAALLGSARAYKGHGDARRAVRSARELVDTYPDTAEASQARADFNL
jgi:tetratricopeptide (TPR) repeat protein